MQYAYLLPIHDNSDIILQYRCTTTDDDADEENEDYVFWVLTPNHDAGLAPVWRQKCSLAPVWNQFGAVNAGLAPVWRWFGVGLAPV